MSSHMLMPAVMFLGLEVTCLMLEAIGTMRREAIGNTGKHWRIVGSHGELVRMQKTLQLFVRAKLPPNNFERVLTFLASEQSELLARTGVASRVFTCGSAGHCFWWAAGWLHFR